MDRHAIVTSDLDVVGRYWNDRKFEFLGPANDLFLSFVDPAFCHGEEPRMEPDDLNMLFTNWLLFEFPVFDRKTPLEEFIAHPPKGSDPTRLMRLEQVARTQFFSRFAILDKDPGTGVAALSDVVTKRRYDVSDPFLCEKGRWKDGSIGMRIACVDGYWHIVGQTRLYDRARPEHTDRDGPGFFHEEDRILRPEAQHMGFYLRMLRDIIGIEGRYRHTTSIRHDTETAAGKPQP
ncbi:hypothetical protein [Enorma phocaeensis]|uniref:Uncharacterized protein n=1 Tax=Enorma phocaeensis TaxID=1871019 RepID=A0A921IXY6_9ACTN|nr:hypothetical protein [Enorma phocaeensis]HJG38070.1 hypothetical protein [Enorma phocaeensis]